MKTPEIRNKVLVLPEGMTKRGLKSWLKENDKKFPIPKKRSNAIFQETIALHERLKAQRERNLKQVSTQNFNRTK